MPKKPKKKTRKRKGKKPKKKRKKVLKAHYFEVKDSKIIRKKKSCPKCGAGTFLAEHKDRYSCGKCSYSEWKTSKQEEKQS